MRKAVRCYFLSEKDLEAFGCKNKKKGVCLKVKSVKFGSKLIIKSKTSETVLQCIERLKAVFGDVFVREDAENLPRSLVKGFLAQKLVLGLAESCTGGLAGALLTDIPGSSEMFWGSYVTYSNNFKEHLGVPKEVLNEHGAVSERTVREMAKMVLSKSPSDVSCAISGIAGPGGGTDMKPVGTVWVCVASRRGREEAFEFLFTGGRKDIRKKSCIAAFCLILGLIEGKKLLDSIMKTKYSKIYSFQNI